MVHVGEVRTLQGKWPRLVSSVAADIQQAELDVKASPLKQPSMPKEKIGKHGGRSRPCGEDRLSSQCEATR